MDGPLLTALGIAVVAFASTNIDGLVVLVGFLADPAYRLRQVILGEFLGMAVLTGASLACALLAVAVPGEYVGLLGIAPMLIGMTKLRCAWRARRMDATPQEKRPASRSRVLAVAGVTVANGGDNLGTYIPLFATSTARNLAATLTVFAVMATLWCVIAHRLVRNHTLSALARRWGTRVLPFVLVALGTYILWQSGSFDLLGG